MRYGAKWSVPGGAFMALFLGIYGSTRFPLSNLSRSRQAVL